MNRRSFFATLLAPLVARFAPKPLTEFKIGEKITIAGVYKVNPAYAYDFQERFDKAMMAQREYDWLLSMQAEAMTYNRFVDIMYPDGTRKRVGINERP